MRAQGGRVFRFVSAPAFPFRFALHGKPPGLNAMTLNDYFQTHGANLAPTLRNRTRNDYVKDAAWFRFS